MMVDPSRRNTPEAVSGKVSCKTDDDRESLVCEVQRRFDESKMRSKTETNYI